MGNSPDFFFNEILNHYTFETSNLFYYLKVLFILWLLCVIVVDLIMVLLVWGPQEEFSVANPTAYTHLHHSSYLWYGHIADGIKRALLISKNTQFVGTLFTCFMATELACVSVASPQLFVTDNTLCLLTVFLFYRSFQVKDLFIELKVKLFVAHVDLVCIPHHFSWKVNVMAVLLICYGEKLAACMDSGPGSTRFNSASFS